MAEAIRSVEVRAHGHFQRLSANSSSADCLCSFDIDRTLTGKQGDTRTCPSNEVVSGVRDSAYCGNHHHCELTWSKFGRNIGNSFCKNCYLALVSAGNAGGKNSPERRALIEQLKASGGKLVSEEWSGPSKDRDHRRSCGSSARWYASTLVVGCQDGSKQEAVKGLVSMLRSRGITIEKDRVYHYDDRVGNVLPFQGTGFNAQQISCKYREQKGAIGLCGAEGSLVKEDRKGVHQCAPPRDCDPGGPVWNGRVSAQGGGTCGSHISFLVNSQGKNMDDARAQVAKEMTECKDCAPDADDVDDDGGEGGDNPDGPGIDIDSEEGDGFEEFKGKKVQCPADKAEAAKVYSGPKEASIDVCKQWCKDEEACKCMVYSKEKKHCWTATKCDKEDWAADSKYDLYFKAEDENPRYKTLINRNAFVNNGAVHLNLDPKAPLSPAGCMNWCSQVAECECATYNVAGKKCWLRKACVEAEMKKYGRGYNVFVKLKDSEVKPDGDGTAPAPTPGDDSGTPGPTPAPRPAAPKDCKTATSGNGMLNCYQACTWARNNGVKRSPSAYGGLTALNPFEDFQNWMHGQEDPQGCTVKACDPPPQQPPGVNIRVTPALPTRGENKVRVSMVRYAGTPSPDSGDVKWTYSRQFQHRWTDCHLKSAIVEVVPGKLNSFNLDGTDVQIKIPKKDDGVLMFLMADPKFNDKLGAKFDVLGITHNILNKMAGEIDYWSVIGDNWYDIKGGYHKQVFSGLSLNASTISFSAVLGNHDYMIQSLWNPMNIDSFGFGHTQWYALDAMSAKDNEKEPFDISNGPGWGGMRQWELKKHITSASNNFFYHNVGNVLVIGYSAVWSWQELHSWFEEACEYAGTANKKVVLVLGHWDGNNHGSKLKTPTAVEKVKWLNGCRGKIVKGAMGHAHWNKKVGNDNFLIGGWGYGWSNVNDGTLGIPFLDTRGGRAKFKWFQIVKSQRWLPRGQELLSCLYTKGAVRDCEFPGHYQVWMDEPI